MAITAPLRSTWSGLPSAAWAHDTAISPAGWTLPSHASIFTGLYPSRHGAHEQHKYVLAGYPTMAQPVRPGGYYTLAFCHNSYVSPTTVLDRGFEEFNPVARSVHFPLTEITRKLESGMAMLLGLRDSGARRVSNQICAGLRRLRCCERPFLCSFTTASLIGLIFLPEYTTAMYLMVFPPGEPRW